MNRNNIFVLSWGRKMFFGLGWPLLCLIAFSYFQNGVLPSTPLEIFYYLVTHIGHYGLITAVLYFVLYVPMASLFPNYYFTRLWSMGLLIVAGILIFVDSIVFGLYRFHINNFILDLIVDGAGKDIFKLHPSVYIIATTLFLAVMGYFWYRGESTWRSMQRRFSNPNKNWYLILISALVLISHLLHIYGDAYGNRKITRHANNFPLYFAATAKGILGDSGLLPEKLDIQEGVLRDFNYPREKLNCSDGEDRNILLITVNDWKAASVNENDTPMLNHYQMHGRLFNNHKSGSLSVTGGIFTLLYGLPETYLKEARSDQVAPVFFDELQSRGTEIGIFADFALKNDDLMRTVFLKVAPPALSNNVNSDWKAWLDSHLAKESGKPFFGMVSYSSPVGIDQRITDLIEGLHAKGLTKKTIIVITGSNGREIPEGLNVPLIIIWPETQFDSKNFATSHYDVIPSIMSEEWNCRNSISTYSDGQSFFDFKPKDWFILGNEHEYKIIDYQRSQIVTVDPLRGYSVTDFLHRPIERTQAQTDLILSALQEQSRFRKKPKK